MTKKNYSFELKVIIWTNTNKHQHHCRDTIAEYMKEIYQCLMNHVNKQADHKQVNPRSRNAEIHFHLVISNKCINFVCQHSCSRGTNLPAIITENLHLQFCLLTTIMLMRNQQTSIILIESSPLQWTQDSDESLPKIQTGFVEK